MKIRLQKVHYMPGELQSGILYVSSEFGTAAHLCACGCGSKIRTPLGPTEWQIEEHYRGPTLYPSVGNWQQPCRSHYWISKGEVYWADEWSPEQIVHGRKMEQSRREDYYSALYKRETSFIGNFWMWLKSYFEN